MRIVPKKYELIKLRLLKGHSRESLAKVAGLSDETLRRIEDGNSLRPLTAKKLQTALQTDFESIFTIK